MINNTYNSTEHKIKKLDNLEGKTKINFYQNISSYYDEMYIRRQSKTFQFEEDPSFKNAEVISKNYRELLLWMSFLQTKPDVELMNFSFYD